MLGVVIILVLVSIFYTLGLIIYRLVFHPIARFPGPKFAAATFWYEFYYDVVRRGQYFKEIEKMHAKYGSGLIASNVSHQGPIVRINPQELHINDPEFYSTLYTGASHRRDKWAWAAKMFGNSTSVFSTVSHDHHRIRRKALNPLFSKVTIKKLEPMLQAHLHELCIRIDEFCESDKVLNIGLAFAVFAGDMISEYCFGTSFGQLHDPRFAPEWVDEIAAPSELAHLVKQVPAIVPLLRYIPRRLVRRIAPSIHRLYNIQEKMGAQVQSIMLQTEKTTSVPYDSPPCVFDALVASSLPAQEKTVERLRGEGQTLIGAGTLTTAHVLKTILFHLLDNPPLLREVTEELDQVFPDRAAHSEQIPSLEVLEKLPLLTACITEGLRMAYGVTHRLQLVAPEESLDFQEYHIPPGTPVGMTSIFMHDNPNIFPEPSIFRPGRWLDAEEAKYLSRYFVAFSKGTRMCLGMHLAWAEVYLVLGCLLTRYRFDLYETVVEDVKMAHDFFDPAPRLDSEGLRVRVRKL